MDGLDEFEKQLAADKAQREKHHDAKHRRHHHGDEASKHGTRRHRERHDEHHHHHDGSKRRRVSQHGGRKHHDSSPRRSEKHGETIDAKHEGLKRDAWMTAPSALDVEYIQSRGPDSRPSGPPREEPQRVVHARELNRALVDDDAAKHTDSCPETRDDDSAAPGTLDDSATPKTLDDSATPKTLDASALNRLRAQMIKAKLRRAPNAAQLEQEYQAAASCQAAAPAPAPVVLGAMHSRQLAGSSRGEVKPVMTRRGRERGQVEQNDELSIGDMVAEERRTKGQVGGEGARLAERIARDGRFQDNLEYMDDQAAKLARHVERNDAAIRSAAVADLHKVSAAIDSCRLCHDSDRGGGPVAPVVSLGTRVYLTLAPAPQVSPGSAVIVPLAHHANLVGCDDDEWEEMRNFMKSLTRMYHEQGREVVFYEDAAFARGAAHRRHACLVSGGGRRMEPARKGH
ncbi:hypothetical protein CDD82_2172 [Ophiocordyceps australis]|uniref:Cwf19-like C-terminal domain-containing protein n=1 Tax=Ophiocordyceps australis TaxID=1399860 RepID=A0A2C5XV46_9HYPO|nr:hypothetical protein CDD82_2172 [Ophiocordyceps australis]